MSIFKKASAFLTAVCLAAALTGCSDTTYGLVVDDYTVPAGIYIYYANSAYNNAVSELLEQDPEFDTSDTEAVKDAVKALTIDGVDSLTWIQNKATELCTNYVAVEKKFDELGLELDAVTKDNIDYMVEYYWASYQESMEDNGVSEDSFTKIMTSSYKSEKIFEYYYGIGGENGVTEEQVKEYYIENNIRTEYVCFELYDGAGNMLKSDGKKDMMDMVEAYKERVESALEEGGVEAVMTEMSIVKDEYSEYCTSISEEAAATADGSNSASEAEETTTEKETTTEETTTEETTTEETTAPEETETDENGSLVTEETEETVENEETETTTTAAEESEDGEETTTTVAYPNERIITVVNEEDYEEGETISYTPSEDVYKKLIAIKEKDYGKPYILEEDEAYYLVVRYDITDRMTEEDLWTEDQIYSVEVSMFDEDFEAYIQEWSDALTVTRNEAAYKRYNPFKFDFAF